MPHDLASVERKIAWANEHIRQLAERWPVLANMQPYSVFPKDSPESPGRIDQCIRINEPAATEVLSEVSLRSGDAVHALRSALDHLACAAVGTHNVTTDTAFPVWRSRKTLRPNEQQYKSLVETKVGKAPNSFRKLVRAMEPYERGSDNLIWALDYLDIVDKHRLLIEAFGGNLGMTMLWPPPLMPDDEDYGKEEDPEPTPMITYKLSEGPLEIFSDGDVLLTVDEHSQTIAQPAIEIVFGEPECLRGEAVLPTLGKLSQVVRATVDSLGRALDSP
jgi:hypothetical protein